MSPLTIAILAWAAFAVGGFIIGCVDSYEHGYLTWTRVVLAATLAIFTGPLFFLAALIVADSSPKESR